MFLLSSYSEGLAGRSERKKFLSNKSLIVITLGFNSLFSFLTLLLFYKRRLYFPVVKMRYEIYKPTMLYTDTVQPQNLINNFSKLDVNSKPVRNYHSFISFSLLFKIQLQRCLFSCPEDIHLPIQYTIV